MPSHVRFSARHASHMRTASPLVCHRMIAGAHEADSGCEAMPSHVRLGGARFIPAPAWNLLGVPSDDRLGARGGFRVRGMPSHVRFGGARFIPAPSVIPCRLPWQPQRGISWACHRIIDWAPAMHLGCEAMPSHVRLGGARFILAPASFHAGCLGNLSVESPGLAIGSSIGRLRCI
jgi:hypothetical protein